MIKHRLERILVGFCVLASVGFAIHGQWSAGSYFLMAAAVVDFDDWTHK